MRIFNCIHKIQLKPILIKRSFKSRANCLIIKIQTYPAFDLMIRFTIAGLAAIISTASAIQTQADASAQYYGSSGFNFNPWSYSPPSYGGYGGYGGYSSSPFSYGISSKIEKVQKDVTYLVKMNTSLKTRMTSVEDAITALQNGSGSGSGSSGNTAALEARITALEEKAASNSMAISSNDSEISDLDVKIADDEGDLSMIDMMTS